MENYFNTLWFKLLAIILAGVIYTTLTTLVISYLRKKCWLRLNTKSLYLLNGGWLKLNSVAFALLFVGVAAMNIPKCNIAITNKIITYISVLPFLAGFFMVLILLVAFITTQIKYFDPPGEF